jgi:hypothetical protein
LVVTTTDQGATLCVFGSHSPFLARLSIQEMLVAGALYAFVG